jgi:hypothetical protein
MSLDLLVKIIVLPASLYWVHVITATQTHQSLSPWAVSVQYEAIRNLGGQTSAADVSFPVRPSEEGLEVNILHAAGKVTVVGDCDFARAVSFSPGQSLALLGPHPDGVNPLTLLGESPHANRYAFPSLTAVTNPQIFPNQDKAIAPNLRLDNCFMARSKMALGLDDSAIKPIRQMPNLAYYDYASSTDQTMVNIEDDSATFFLFRETQLTAEKAEKRQQIMQSARKNINQWNAF